MSKRRIPIWLLAIVLCPALIAAFVLGLWAWAGMTAPTLHPNPQDAPSVTRFTPPAQWASAVDRARQIVRASLNEQNLPGLSVAVGAGGDLIWAEGFGWADLEGKLPVAPEMRFRIGSASKVLTSAAVGLLLENGRLKLDDEIQTYVPEYPRKEWPITLRQLMGHVSGVRTDDGDEGPFGEHCERTVEGLTLFATRSLWFEPGTQFRNSNFGWILVSAAVEAAAKEPFLIFMRNQVFEPLGMTATRPDSLTEPIADKATFYFPRFAADPRYGLQSVPYADYTCYAGSMAFLSTPSDLVRFAMGINGHLRQGFGGQGGRLLQPTTVQLLQTSQRLRSGEETGYGLGWDLETVELAGAQTRLAGHDGESIGGMLASLMTFPDGLTVAVTSNVSWTDTYAIGVKIAQAFAEQAKRPR